MGHAVHVVVDTYFNEIVAELGSAVLAECLQLGHGENLGTVYGYIESYAKDSEKSLEAACMECLDRICQAVTLVIDTAESLKAVAPSAVA